MTAVLNQSGTLRGIGAQTLSITLATPGIFFKSPHFFQKPIFLLELLAMIEEIP